MRFSKEFKIELKKAIKLSTFLTVLVFGMVLVSYEKESGQNREVASILNDSALAPCPVDANGNAVPSIGRSVPPFERKPCASKISK